MRANTNLIAVIQSVKYQLWSICKKLHNLMIAKWIADENNGWNGLQLVCDCWRWLRGNDFWFWIRAMWKSVASLTDWWKKQHTLSVIFDKIGDADGRKQNRRFVAKYNKETSLRRVFALRRKRVSGSCITDLGFLCCHSTGPIFRSLNFKNR